MPKKLKMPERTADDGAVRVSRVDEKIAIQVTDGGSRQELVMGQFNAWRIFGMLSLFLEIPLPPHIGKAIKMGDETKAKVS